MILITGACGAGKTKKALQITQDVASSQGRVLYVAPTRALAEQFAKELEKTKIKVSRAYGRRLGENCENPDLDIAIALGEGFSPVCESCCFRPRCEYLRGVREITDWTFNVIVTTYHFIAWSLPETYPRPNLVILDDINDPILSSPSKMPPKPTSLVSIRAGPKKNKQFYFLPRLPMGEENLVISATPPRSILYYQMGGGSEIEEHCIDDSPPLDQTVLVHLAHCTHTSPWFPPPGTCGFKKNTSPGLPYFRASSGLNDWRGIGLQVAGTFSPPIQAYAITAAILSILSGEQYKVVFLPAVMEFENKKIRTAIFCIKNHKLVVDASAMASAFPLIQLLGRAGKGVETIYYGDIPLNFFCDGERIRFASRVVLASAPPEVVEFHTTRHRVASYLAGELSQKRLSASERRYLGFVNSILNQANREMDLWVAQKTQNAKLTNGPNEQ